MRSYRNYRKRRSIGGASNWKPAVDSKFGLTRQKGQLPFGRRLVCHLPYSETTALSASNVTNLSSVRSYRLNSLYAPQSSTHQPYQYDQLTDLYSVYMVHGAKVSITFQNPDTDNVYVGYRIRSHTDTTTSSGKTLDYLNEMQDSHIVPIVNSGGQKRKFDFYIPIHKGLGITKQQYLNDRQSWCASTGASPSELWLDLVVLTLSSGVSSDTVYSTTDIIYYAEFNGMVSPAQS